MTLDEIDKLAAEKIIGWQNLGGEYHNGDKHPLEPIRYGDNSPGGRWWNVWQPTRNIAQAWELLEKQKFGKYFVIMQEGDKYGCELSRPEEDYPPWVTKETAWADTAPEAITRACLKAVGVEIE